MVRIRCDDVTYHVTMTGSGYPLLLLHGFTGSIRSWDEQVNLWQANYKVIAVDLLGHGQSDAPHQSDRYDMILAIRDLITILDQLEISQVAMLGYSMGGRLALSFALQHPHRVSALILESASPGLATEEEREERLKQDQMLADQIEQRGIEWFVNHWENVPLFASVGQLPEHKRSALRHQRLANRPEALAHSLRGMSTGAQPSWWQALGNLQLPTLLLAGEYDIKFREIAKQMQRQITRSTYECVHGAGHIIHLEQPEAFNTLVVQYLKQQAWSD